MYNIAVKTYFAFCNLAYFFLLQYIHLSESTLFDGMPDSTHQA